jgi:hypothetical protein
MHETHENIGSTLHRNFNLQDECVVWDPHECKLPEMLRLRFVTRSEAFGTKATNNVKWQFSVFRGSSPFLG